MHSMCRILCATSMVLLLAPSEPLLAQAPVVVRWHQVTARLPASVVPARTSRDTVLIPSTYWLEGAAAGGVALGLLGALGLGGWCASEGSGSCIGAYAFGLIVGGAFGFGTGALVGGQFPKH